MIELWDNGEIDGRRRKSRYPTPASINGLWVASQAPGYVDEVACTAAGEDGQRCSDRVGGYGFYPSRPPGQRFVRGVETEAVEFGHGWIVCSRLELGVVDLDRWLRQRCLAHANPIHPMWCVPEWEALDVVKHRVRVYEKRPEWIDGMNQAYEESMARLDELRKRRGVQAG